MIEADDDIFVLFVDKSSLCEIEDTWRKLSVVSNVSYFHTWGWIKTWLQELPNDCNIYFVQKRQKEKIVLAFFIGMKKITRNKIFKIRQLCLNVSGNSEYDNIWLEYNGFLCSKGLYEHDLMEILKAIPLEWDEVCLPGLDLSIFPGNSLASVSSPFRYVEDNSTVSPYVDLNKVRKVDCDYLSLLSGNTRSQIRRSFRELAKIGSVELEIPNRVEHAFEVYREMVDLHQATWKSRGQEGVFSSPLFCRFHERLIRNRFDKGEIQLLRIHVKGKTLGCLYSFFWQGRIYFYQCGFNYSFGKKVQPGLVSHVMAVKYNAEQGHDVYDFLAGDARYKRSLATDYNRMAWGRIQRTSWKLKVEEKLRGLFEMFRDNKKA